MVSRLRYAVTATLIIVLFFPCQAFAQLDYGDFPNQEIYVYDPQACATGATAFSSTGAAAATPSGKNSIPNTFAGSALPNADQANLEAALHYFTDKGFSLAAASGFAGNMVQESWINPRMIQGIHTADDNYRPVNGVGFGLIQWTFTARQQPLVDLASKSGRKITDINLQLDFIWQELTTDYKSTLTKLAATGITPLEAAIIVHGKTNRTGSDPRFANAPSNGYEASGDTADTVINMRGMPAQDIYNYYKGKIADGDPSKLTSFTTPTAANGGSSMAGTATGSCGQGSAVGTVYTTNGMAFPLVTSKDMMLGGSDGNPKTSNDVWCYTKTTNCHHDYNAADLMVPEGTQVVAVRSGTIQSINQSSSGAGSGLRASLTLKDDASGIWFMTHGQPGSITVQKGQKVTAGTPLMKVGNNAAADNTPSHLHIDQLPSATYSSRPSCAGPSCANLPFIDIQPQMKELFDALVQAQATGTPPSNPGSQTPQ